MRFSVVAMLCGVAACGPRDASQTAHLLKVDLVGRYGSADSLLSLQLIGSMTLTQGEGDTVLITQYQVPALLMLSSSGDSLGMIGRAGSGPGEFSAPLTPSILKDTLWIPDRSGTILRFDAGGHYIDQLRPHIPPLGPFQSPPRMTGALADGSLLFQGISNPVGRHAQEAVRALAFVRADRTGTILDTLGLVAVRESSYVLELSSDHIIVGSHPAENGDLGCVDPEGRWIVMAAQRIGPGVPFGFLLSWISLAGDTLARQMVEVEPISSEALKAEWIRQLATSERLSPGAVEAAASHVPFPEYQAPAMALLADPNGSALVRSAHPSPDSARWYVVDRERGALGFFVLPNRVQLLAVKGKWVWGWTRGRFDEPYVVKFRASW